MPRKTQTPQPVQAPELSPTDDARRLLKEATAAALLGVTPRFMQKARAEGSGPAFVRVSPRAIRYRRQDLDVWILARTRTSTTEAAA